MRPSVAMLIHAIVASCFLIVSVAAQDLQDWLLSWIPRQCCVTNECCWEIRSSEVQSLPNDQWRIVASGQVLKRTDWSPDGKYYRCACDSKDGKWVVHPTAFTRCLFVPMQSS